MVKIAGSHAQIIEEEILQLRVLAIGLGDITQENGLDDAASSPHGAEDLISR